MTSARCVTSSTPPRRARRDVKRAMIDWWGPVIYEYYGGTEIGVGDVCDSEDGWTNPGTVGQHLRRRRSCAFTMTTAGCCRGRDRRDLSSGRPTLARSSPTTARTTSASRSSATATSPRRRRLHRRRRLRLPLRPQARHGDLGRRQHLSGRDRGVRCSQLPGVHDVRGVRHPRRRIRRGAVPPTSSRSRLRSTSARPPCASTSGPGWPATRCRRCVVFDCDLPREESGKIFKRRIREPYWEQAGRSI